MIVMENQKSQDSISARLSFEPELAVLDPFADMSAGLTVLRLFRFSEIALCRKAKKDPFGEGSAECLRGQIPKDINILP